MGWAYSTDEP